MLKQRDIAWAFAAILATAFPYVAGADDFIVDPAAPLCLGGKGDEGEPVYCTIQAAIDAAYLDGGGDVAILPGIYRESLILRDDVKIKGDDDGVIIELPGGALPEALVVTANHSGIHNVTLRLPEGANASIPVVKISGVEEVEIEEVIIDGGFNRGSIGVFVTNLLLETSSISQATLRRLEVGVLAEDTLFRITRCLFEDMLRDGIHAASPAAKDDDEYETPDVGDEDDLELSGFNRFRNIGGFFDDGGLAINDGDSYFLRNTTGTILSAQLNDWGQYATAEIAARISEQLPGAKRAAGKAVTSVVFEPYLGKSIFPGSVFVRLRDAVSLAPILNGNPRLALNSIDTSIAPGFDTVSKLYSFTFINPNTYSVLGQAPTYFSSSRQAVVGPGQIVALEIPLQPGDGGGEGEGEGEGEPVFHSTDTDGDGRIGLSELLRTVQFYNSTAYHCAVGTEDGFAPDSGDQSCSPHAADYAPQDWDISLSETLRNIQFYNSDGYYPCVGSEDGFCPGAAVPR